MQALVRFWTWDPRALAIIAGLTLLSAMCGSWGLSLAVGAFFDAELVGPARVLRLGIGGLAFAVSVLLTRFAVTRGMQLGEASCDRQVLRIAALIRRAGLRDIEMLGSDTLLNTLSRETGIMLDASWLGLTGLRATCLALSRLLFLALIAPLAFLVILAVCAAAAPTLRALTRRQVAAEQESSRVERTFLRLADQVMHGFVWFKLDRFRREDMRRNFLHPTLEAAREADVAAGRALAVTASFIDLIAFLALILIAAFAPPDAAKGHLSVSLILILACWIDAAEIMGVYPSLIGAAGSARRLEEMEQLLARADIAAVLPPLQSFTRISFRQVEYEHRDRDGQILFRLGPIDLELRRGEVLFIVGGNGSGKTTLAKLISGLYAPSAGQILVDDRPVAGERLRGLFGAVFSDYHLFDRLHGLETVDEALAARLLERFGLSRVTALRQGRFATKDLSTGQRKRLALVVAVLEGRPVLLYDEWASDQDPEFRAYFYRSVIPEQRARGVTVIAVTHDDRYFDCADRIVELEIGQIRHVRETVA